jgi:hypothetical protein
MCEGWKNNTLSKGSHLQYFTNLIHALGQKQGGDRCSINGNHIVYMQYLDLSPIQHQGVE